MPDHRHRCYAEARPAPRALAHQEAYCLSSAFPVCPTFQDWARREAARSRGGAPTAPSASAGMNRAATGAAADAATGAAADAAAGAAVAPVEGAASPDLAKAGVAAANDQLSTGRGDDVDAGHDDRATTHAPEPHADDLVRRNPPRDWAAPPPWLASSEARSGEDAEPPSFLGHRSNEPGRGLAGSPADRLAGGPPSARPHDTDDGDWSSESRSAAALGAGLAAGGASSAGGAGAGRRSTPPVEDEHGEEDEHGRQSTRRPRAYAQHLGGTDGPDWERPRRYEVYPTIKTRVRIPAVPRILGLSGLVIVLALALFFLPGILNLGGGTASPGGSAGSSLRPGPSTSHAPTEPPAATPIVYTIKKNDTLLQVAKAHGITIEQLLAANPQIKNANKISEGQQITIPTPSAAPPDTIGSSTAP